LRVVIAGGGTGGHLYPGIAVARQLLAREPQAIVSFAGTAAGLEMRVIPVEGFPLDLIRSGGIKGKTLGGRLRGFGMLPLSAMDAWRVLSRRKPDLVVGLGGFSSGPVVLLAALRRIPTMLLEQNAVPGVTNRLLSRVVDVAAVTWDSALPHFGSRGLATGNPVRPEFFQIPALREGGEGTTRLLVFGGSRGAHAINVAMAEAAPLLAAARARLVITHQTGEADVQMVREAYRAAGLDARVEPFIYAMDRVVAAADLLVCRAGATTLAEIAAAGRPAILIPLPTATDDHQRKNAQAMAEHGAAEVIDQTELTGETLAARILGLAGDLERRNRLAVAARLQGRPDAVERIADAALALVRRTRSGR
jgi:UDP-N-acetylglucosamine--N-acetylmuramyl-(pentapeptide) pyrophosphoryl-undecaprenol N-acetylglucosamine transferase